MPVVKVVELLAELEESWEDAAKQAVEEATKTIRGVRSVYISEFQATVGHGRVAQPFGFRPHRSGHAAFPHPALPEGNPRHGTLSVHG